MSENEQAGKIMDFIDSKSVKMTIEELGKWCQKNNCFQTLSLSFDFFERYLYNHNQKIKKD